MVFGDATATRHWLVASPTLYVHTSYLGSVAGRTFEFLDKLPPAGRLGFSVHARDKHP